MEKRRQVSKACANCRMSHVSCSVERPCRRCIQTGREASCEDRPRKRREMRQKATQNEEAFDMSMSGDAVQAAIEQRKLMLRSLSVDSGVMLHSMSDSDISRMPGMPPNGQMSGLTSDSPSMQSLPFGMNPPYFNFMMPRGMPDATPTDIMSLRSVSSPAVSYLSQQGHSQMFAPQQADMSVYYGNMQPFNNFSPYIRSPVGTAPTPSSPSNNWAASSRTDPHQWLSPNPPPAGRIPIDDSSGSLKTFSNPSISSSVSSPVTPGVASSRGPDASIPGFVVFRTIDYSIVDYNRLFVEIMQMQVDSSVNFFDCLAPGESKLTVEVVFDLTSNSGKVRMERQTLRNNAECCITYMCNPVQSDFGGTDCITACIYLISRSPRSGMP